MLVTREVLRLPGQTFEVVEAGGDGTLSGEAGWSLVRERGRWFARAIPPADTPTESAEAVETVLGPYETEALALRALADRLLVALLILERPRPETAS